MRNVLLLLVLCWHHSFAGETCFFTENKGQVIDTKGQVRSDILFYADTKEGRLYISEHSISLVSYTEKKEGDKTITSGFRTEIDISNLTNGIPFTGSDQLPFYSNYYLPQRKDGILHVRHFRDLRVKDYLRNADLVFYFKDDGSIAYDFFANGKEHQGCEPVGELLSPELLKVQQGQSTCTPWSTYYGASGNDEGWGITLDADQNSYTSGYTSSTNFPVNVGAFQDVAQGNYDAFIIKMDSCGNRQWATYIGSSGNDFGERICLCGKNVVQCGYTSGTDFPVSGNAFQPASNGGYEGYLFKIDPSGARVWATYFGGSGGELGTAVCCDANKNIFFGGATSSTDLPVQNAFQSSNNGPMEAFVAKFDSNGVRRWCTYYGGSSSEDVHSMCTDNTGHVIAVGGSFSSDLSISVGAFQPGTNGVQDAYIIKFDSAGARVFSTYFGGSGNEDAYGVCTDAQGTIYLSGYTTSADFPVTTNVYQGALNNGDDLYLAAFSPSGSQLWCTYFGGSANEEAYAMGTDMNGHLFLAATTSSTDLPVIGTPVQGISGGQQDAFVVKFTTSGTPTWSTYFGGSLDDAAYDIAVSPGQRLFLTGFTNSNDFPVTFGAFQTSNAAPEDAFISGLDGRIDITTGIGSSAIPQLIIYPDPVSDQLFVKLYSDEHGQVKATLYDAGGRVVFSKESELDKGLHYLNYDLRNLREGVYFLVFDTGKERSMKKVMVQH